MFFFRGIDGPGGSCLGTAAAVAVVGAVAATGTRPGEPFRNPGEVVISGTLRGRPTGLFGAPAAGIGCFGCFDRTSVSVCGCLRGLPLPRGTAAAAPPGSTVLAIGGICIGGICIGGVCAAVDLTAGGARGNVTPTGCFLGLPRPRGTAGVIGTGDGAVVVSGIRPAGETTWRVGEASLCGTGGGAGNADDDGPGPPSSRTTVIFDGVIDFRGLPRFVGAAPITTGDAGEGGTNACFALPILPLGRPRFRFKGVPSGMSWGRNVPVI